METTPLLPRTRKKSLWSRFVLSRFKRREYAERTIDIGLLPVEQFPPNYVCNQKYSIITFLPLVLFEQFKYFLNLYFLVMACSQFIPSIRIGYLYTYWGPLIFVISVTVFREAVDDFRRYRRDREVNRQRYERVCMDLNNGYHQFKTEKVAASSLRVGDIVMLQKGERVPADMILLRTNDSAGTVYVRTDQLDGETDWKLRMSLPSTQKLQSDAGLLQIHAKIHVEKPQQDIYSFIGRCTRFDVEDTDPVDIQNTLWSGCVVASGHATGLVIYTGSETRAVMNNSTPRSKIGRLDLKLNDFTKLLFIAVLGLSFLLIVLKGFNGPWYGFMFRFLLLFSYIIPISLRVNLDMSKVYYTWTIQRDNNIAGTVMRSTNIPEELGRVNYVLADKTGTLTKNEMVFQKLHLEEARFNRDNFHEVESLLTQHATLQTLEEDDISATEVTPSRAWESVLALALCHNVTPVARDNMDNRLDDSCSDMTGSVVSESCGGAVPQQQLCEYQASSPDEIALVNWTDMMGVSLYERDLHNISVKVRATNDIMAFTILQIFPFTSETKMMGIIVQEEVSGAITYYVKGADVALARSVNSSWMITESKRLAAEGLRTLVYAKKCMTQKEYDTFEAKYRSARCSKERRNENTAYVISKLNEDLKLLAVTGVEDKLADNVTDTLDKLRKAGIKTWMLTGDKLETALCIARSLRLSDTDSWYVAPSCRDRLCAHVILDAIGDGRPLIIEGDALEMCLQSYPAEFLSALCGCAAVCVARCSPTQKAEVARRLRKARATKELPRNVRPRAVLAVGDGGNDVAMIQEADVGVGISGAEGRAASLAGDVGAAGFGALARLLLVHGRRCDMRSAALSLFIVHRGLIVSTMQAVFSVVFYFSSVSLYPGFLMVGYGTIYTMLPVFSLVLDKDLPSSVILKHPQLYKQLAKGRHLSYKTFCIWTAISIYQGGVIMYGALVLFEDQLIHIVEISYTALILTELIMVALSIVTWHRLMFIAEMFSLGMYIATLLIFNSYFDSDFLRQWSFWWKVMVITLVSCLPLYIVKIMRKQWRHRQYRNLRNFA